MESSLEGGCPHKRYAVVIFILLCVAHNFLKHVDLLGESWIYEGQEAPPKHTPRFVAPDDATYYPNKCENLLTVRNCPDKKPGKFKVPEKLLREDKVHGFIAANVGNCMVNYWQKWASAVFLYHNFTFKTVEESPLLLLFPIGSPPTRWSRNQEEPRISSSQRELFSKLSDRGLVTVGLTKEYFDSFQGTYPFIDPYAVFRLLRPSLMEAARPGISKLRLSGEGPTAQWLDLVERKESAVLHLRCDSSTAFADDYGLVPFRTVLANLEQNINTLVLLGTEALNKSGFCGFYTDSLTKYVSISRPEVRVILRTNGSKHADWILMASAKNLLCQMSTFCATAAFVNPNTNVLFVSGCAGPVVAPHAYLNSDLNKLSPGLRYVESDIIRGKEVFCLSMTQDQLYSYLVSDSCNPSQHKCVQGFPASGTAAQKYTPRNATQDAKEFAPPFEIKPHCAVQRPPVKHCPDRPEVTPRMKRPQDRHHTHAFWPVGLAQCMAHFWQAMATDMFLYSHFTIKGEEKHPVLLLFPMGSPPAPWGANQKEALISPSQRQIYTKLVEQDFIDVRYNLYPFEDPFAALWLLRPTLIDAARPGLEKLKLEGAGSETLDLVELDDTAVLYLQCDSETVFQPWFGIVPHRVILSHLPINIKTLVLMGPSNLRNGDELCGFYADSLAKTLQISRPSVQLMLKTHIAEMETWILLAATRNLICLSSSLICATAAFVNPNTNLLPVSGCVGTVVAPHASINTHLAKISPGLHFVESDILRGWEVYCRSMTKAQVHAYLTSDRCNAGLHNCVQGCTSNCSRA